jgi:hypothetical protein
VNYELRTSLPGLQRRTPPSATTIKPGFEPCDLRTMPRVEGVLGRSLPRKFTVKRRKEWPHKLLVSKKTITTDLPITSFFESLNG